MPPCEVRMPAILRLDYTHINNVREVAARVRRFAPQDVILQQSRTQCVVSLNL